MKYQNILFDLDGTLTDPLEGITKGFAYAMENAGIQVDNLESLVAFIGPPIRESFARLNFNPEEIENAVAKYREYYTAAGIYENKIYEGIPEMLDMLQQSGKKLALATSKTIPYAKLILEHFKIDRYFTFVAGSEWDGTRSDKFEIINYVLENLKVDASATVMVGDRMHDIIGANKAGVDSIGVLYGYGGLDELQNAGAARIAATVEELGKLLMDDGNGGIVKRLEKSPKHI